MRELRDASVSSTLALRIAYEDLGVSSESQGPPLCGSMCRSGIKQSPYEAVYQTNEARTRHHLGTSWRLFHIDAVLCGAFVVATDGMPGDSEDIAAAAAMVVPASPLSEIPLRCTAPVERLHTCLVMVPTCGPRALLDSRTYRSNSAKISRRRSSLGGRRIGCDETPTAGNTNGDCERPFV